VRILLFQEPVSTSWRGCGGQPGLSRPLAAFDGTGPAAHVLAIHTDQVLRPVLMTDATAAVAWRARFRPFGELISVSGPKSLRQPASPANGSSSKPASTPTGTGTTTPPSAAIWKPTRSASPTDPTGTPMWARAR